MPGQQMTKSAVWAVFLLAGAAVSKPSFGQQGPRQQAQANDAASVFAGAKPLPINLPTALRLANVRPLDVQAATVRVRVGAAQLQQAQALWLPTFYSGTDYYRHDGQNQLVQGPIFSSSKSSLLVGGGPYAVFALSDAMFQPLAQRQVVRGQRATYRATLNDTMLAVAEAYFNVQQARGELAGAAEAVAETERLLERTRQLGEVLVPAFEQIRTRTELSRRRQTLHLARERWGLASAEFNRILRLDPTTVVEPVEPPQFQVTLINAQVPPDELIRIGLTRRPELAASQQVVQATLYRLRQERWRPLTPSVLLRGAAPGVTGLMSSGLFGGGQNASMGNFGFRNDMDVQILWELRNMGFGNRALVREKEAENRLAVLDVLRIEQQVAADIVQARVQVETAAARIRDAEDELRNAQRSLAENLTGLKNTRQVGDLPMLISRPQEVVAAVQALALAYSDYYVAIADYNRAQFRLYRAIGNPGDLLAGQVAGASPSTNSPPPSAAPARRAEPIPSPPPDNSRMAARARTKPVSSRRTAPVAAAPR
jgi:outer membrane protein TolC